MHMKIFTKGLLVALLVIIPVFVLYAAETDNTAPFQSTAYIQGPEISVPTVVEIPITAALFGRKEFAVKDVTSRQFQPHLFQSHNTKQPVYVRASSNVLSQGDTQGNDNGLTDGNSRTHVEYLIANDTTGVVAITLFADKPISASSLNVQLAQYVALPTQVSISAKVGGSDRTVLSSTTMNSQRVTFPQTTASEWKIQLTYSQPLRIEELTLNQQNLESSSSNSIRFLAYPGTSYQLYLNPDRSANLSTNESGNLRSNADVLTLSAATVYSNPTYTQADSDNDGIPDLRDNCVRTANADQLDINNNGRGDVCDDFDRDGVLNDKDNCPDHPNANQRDEDFDGVGDVCDGIESRILEKYAWLPWAGIMFVAAIIGILMVRTLKHEE